MYVFSNLPVYGHRIPIVATFGQATGAKILTQEALSRAKG